MDYWHKRYTCPYFTSSEKRRVDDFLKGNVTEADRNIAFEILNARYIKPECATIISSERTIGQILDWDEAIGSRIAERAKGFTMSVTGSGKNWRLR